MLSSAVSCAVWQADIYLKKGESSLGKPRSYDDKQGEAVVLVEPECEIPGLWHIQSLCITGRPTSS